jgi:hypothetical protein
VRKAPAGQEPGLACALFFIGRAGLEALAPQRERAGELVGLVREQGGLDQFRVDAPAREFVPQARRAETSSAGSNERFGEAALAQQAVFLHLVQHLLDRGRDVGLTRGNGPPQQAAAQLGAAEVAAREQRDRGGQQLGGGYSDGGCCSLRVMMPRRSRMRFSISRASAGCSRR